MRCGRTAETKRGATASKPENPRPDRSPMQQGGLPDYLSLDHLDDLVRRALAEDVGPGDVTTEATVPAGTQAEAHFLAKEDGVVAGLFVAERVFAAVDPALA